MSKSKPKAVKAPKKTAAPVIEDAPELTTEAEVTAAIAEAIAESKAEPQDARPTPQGRSVIPPQVKKGYVNGNCGDEIAKHMGGMDIVALGQWNGVDTKGRWGHLNYGMQRMNLGNVLRRMAKEGTEIRWSPR